MAAPPIAAPTVGAALQYTEQTLGGPINEYDSVVSVSTTGIQLVPLNPDRVGLILINAGSADAYVSFNPAVSANNGIRISSSGGSIAMNLIEDFTLTARQWNAICPVGGPVNIYCIEYARFSYTQPAYNPISTPTTGQTF